MPAAVLRPRLPDAGAGRHREMQVPIRLVLSREVRDVPAHAGGARVQLGGRCIPGSDLSIGTRSRAVPWINYSLPLRAVHPQLTPREATQRHVTSMRVPPDGRINRGRRSSHSLIRES